MGFVLQHLAFTSRSETRGRRFGLSASYARKRQESARHSLTGSRRHRLSIDSTTCYRFLSTTGGAAASRCDRD